MSSRSLLQPTLIVVSRQCAISRTILSVMLAGLQARRARLQSILSPCVVCSELGAVCSLQSCPSGGGCRLKSSCVYLHEPQVGKIPHSTGSMLAPVAFLCRPGAKVCWLWVRCCFLCFRLLHRCPSQTPLCPMFDRSAPASKIHRCCIQCQEHTTLTDSVALTDAAVLASV